MRSGDYSLMLSLMAMTLTDGKVNVKAMEYKPLNSFKEKVLPPGIKVLVSSAIVKTGVILLEDRSFKVSLQALFNQECPWFRNASAS